MYTFYKDKNGICIYYANASGTTRSLIINEKTEFNSGNTSVVPLITRVSTVETVTEIIEYTHQKTGEVIYPSVFNTQLDEINEIDEEDLTLEELIIHQDKKDELINNWVPIDGPVEKWTDYPFEIIDIDYPSDTRLVPLRHYDISRINYFQIATSAVAKAFAHKLCKEAGLKADNAGNQKGTYKISDYSYLDYWRIEGKTYKPEKVNKQSFTGNMEECHAYLDEIEASTQQAFDNWKVNNTPLDEIAIRTVIGNLDAILGYVTRVETKIKTRQQYQWALSKIAETKTELIEAGLRINES